MKNNRIDPNWMDIKFQQFGSTTTIHTVKYQNYIWGFWYAIFRSQKCSLLFCRRRSDIFIVLQMKR